MTEDNPNYGPNYEIEPLEGSPDLPEEAHISIDLETLGRKPGCVILTLGAVVFDPHAGHVDTDGFYGAFGAREQLRAGATVDADTLAWWMNQSQEAQDEVKMAMLDEYALKLTPVPGVLAAFADWCDSKAESVVMWGNGPSFDCGILGALYDKVGLIPPWTFYNEGCVRTAHRLAKMTGWEKPPRAEGCFSHHALHDARYQAEIVCSATKHLARVGIKVPRTPLAN